MTDQLLHHGEGRADLEQQGRSRVAEVVEPLGALQGDREQLLPAALGGAPPQLGVLGGDGHLEARVRYRRREPT